MKTPTFFQRIIQAIHTRYRSTRFQLMDWNITSYLLLIGILVIPFHQDVKSWWIYPFMHLALILILVEFIRFSESRSNRILRAIRIFYPLLFATLGWKELNNLITMIFPYWANDLVIQIDMLLFGVHPTVWVEQFFTPWLTELMNFFYAVFWFYTAIVALALYIKKREQDLFDFFFAVSFAYAVCFTLFLIFPSEGAWIVLKDLHHAEPEGGFFQHLNQAAQAKGTIRGGALPSSHVALSFVVACTSIKYFKRLGILLLILSFGVAVSTVYCRYHHAIDAISGVFTGFLLYWISNRILKKQNN
ncbi:phosphatase PAP2 family protein [candidate division KSB1 bacterium]|nr:phosphatase PAP2 family protein [candidate division KSB1 bacterium]